MQIQKISSFFNINNRIKNNPESTKSEEPKAYVSMPNNITFEARVDKGLVRFYEANAEYMPRTLKTYIENLADKSSKTPRQAQAAAFGALAGVVTVAGIKSLFPEDEELFANLKEPGEIKSTRGILGVFRENRELLEMCDQSILKNKENFTVWLVRKVFMESKTLDEINQDFNNEVDEDFKALLAQREDVDAPIRPSTFGALGIKLPDPKYQQSLRYTREGYSDIVGAKISQSLRDFIDSLPIEERTARARKSVQKFENWWESLSRNEKLDMIAFQIDELEMLKRFNSSDIGKVKAVKKKDEKPTIESKEKAVKVESSLSRDDLFKIWAGNNLKLFEASLTDYDRQRIKLKREQRQAEWWGSMSAEERTEYINRLRTGIEPLRFAMIDAWNKNKDILIELSYTLKKNNINKPTEILYGTEEFNEYFSQVMTEFWASHPDYAERLGEAMRESHDRVKTSIDNGNFELLKRDITNARVKREKEISDAVKNYRVVFTDGTYENYPGYMKEFIQAFNISEEVDVNTMPVKYLQDFYEIVYNDMPEDVVVSWSKLLRKEPLTPMDNENIAFLSKMEHEVSLSMARALESTFSEILYECTGNPDVYLFLLQDSKEAIKQIKNGYENIEIYSKSTNKSYNIPVLKREIDPKKIDKLYSEYMDEVPEGVPEAIIDQYFDCNFEGDAKKERIMLAALKKQIQIYAGSNQILFGKVHNYPPEVQARFAKKFMATLPAKFDRNSVHLKLQTVENFVKERNIQRLDAIISKKYAFLPKDALNMYIYELNKVLRSISQSEIEDFEKVCCKLKKTPEEQGEVVLIDRELFSATHAIYSLCIEQALADILYEGCGNEDVYSLNFEELLSSFESLMLVKKFPMKESWTVPCSETGKNVEFKVKNRIQPYVIERKYREYYDEVTKYVQECVDEKKLLTQEDLLYILNPDENKTKTDELTMNRIKKSFSHALFSNKINSSEDV